jgi:hypothetical protein
MFIKGGIKGENVTRINTTAAANCRMSKTRQKKRQRFSALPFTYSKR